MLRHGQKFEVGRFYHLYNRGNNYQNIFFERENYLHFLRLMQRHLVAQYLDILAYCLMPNHYHLLVQCRDVGASEGLRSLSIAYTKGINRRYKRVGSLFQGRFKGIPIDSDRYLQYLVQYIHLNPVKAGFINAPQNWEFSSYQEYAGLRSGMLPKMDVLRALFGEEEYQTCLTESSISLPSEIRILTLDE